MRCRLAVTWASAASATLASEIPEFAFWPPWVRPLIWFCRRVEIARPAESSAAVLMRRPDDRRFSEVSRETRFAVRLF